MEKVEETVVGVLYFKRMDRWFACKCQMLPVEC